MTDNLEWDRDGGTANTTVISTSVKRSGLSSCGLVRTTDGWGELLQEFSGSNVDLDLYIRFYLYIAVMPDEDADIMVLEQSGGSDDEGGLVLQTNGILYWFNDEHSPDGTAVGALSTGTWYRIEVNYDSASEVSVRLDGTEIINSGTHTGDGVAELVLGLCTLQGSPFCGASDATAELYFDDIAINDTSGSDQNSWSGAGSIVHMQPDGGAGDNNDAGSGTCASVDEVTPDDASTIAVLDDNGDNLDCTVESSSSAGIDSYDTVTLIQVGAREAASTGASETWDLRLKSASGGTTIDGTDTSHNDTTYTTNGDPNTLPRNYVLTSYTDPTTATAWTPTGTNSLDNMQIGMNAVAAVSADINLSTLWALIEYVDGSPPPIVTSSTSRGFFNAGRTLRIFSGGLRVF